MGAKNKKVEEIKVVVPEAAPQRVIERVIVAQGTSFKTDISEAISQGRSAAEETQEQLRGEMKKANENDSKPKTKKSPLDDLGEEA